MTKEEIQKKYDDLKIQYDFELESLDANQTGNAKVKSRKKPPTNRQKPDGTTNENDENSPATIEQMDQQEKLERLQELEKKLVGGEDANNEEKKKKRKKKLNDMKEKQERRKRFADAINADDDDAMIKVFDDVQDKVK